MSEHDDLLHRDDIDADDMQGIEGAFAEMFPGCKVVCAGDATAPLPPQVLEAIKQLEAQHEQSLMNGTCLDCGKQMPDWPAPNEDMPDDWKPADGWRWFTKHGTDEITAWQCPECDQAENDD